VAAQQTLRLPRPIQPRSGAFLTREQEHVDHFMSGERSLPPVAVPPDRSYPNRVEKVGEGAAHRFAELNQRELHPGRQLALSSPAGVGHVPVKLTGSPISQTSLP
jgi:hypothetical protein